jgi:catechol 2,3-dioxygenase-like lactoylglutathione lyase family enzyme
MRLNRVTLQVEDLDRSVAFYTRLGFTQLVADEGHARLDGHRLFLYHAAG